MITLAPLSSGRLAMPVVVVTRLRLKDPALLNEFFTDAVSAIEQAQKSDGNLGADALADADNAWWVAALTDASPENQTRAFPPPVENAS
jgi:hypothetical protein